MMPKYHVCTAVVTHVCVHVEADSLEQARASGVSAARADVEERGARNYDVDDVVVHVLHVEEGD